MKLIDKFLKASRIDGFLNNEEVIAATNVTIANEYAIDFARWILANCWLHDDEYWELVTRDGDVRKTEEELLEIYKIEKGL